MHASKLDGRYRVVREIARGGMGVVYLVEHSVTGKRHAAKVLMSPIAAHAGMVERFRREARSAARIGSRHVVDVTDAGSAPEMGGAPFLVMELLSGLDLSHLIARRGALRSEEVIAILTPIARLLERAHGLGIVHRDLKPANLYLHRDADGRVMVKVLDFGLATAVRGVMEDRAVTATGDVMGTPAYMAPEQAAGHHQAVGPATDLWALGLIAFELLSGLGYWGNASTGQVFAGLIRQQMHAPSQLAPHLGAGFDQWFARACHWDPRQRFGRATEQLDALAQLLGVAIPPPESALPASLQQDVEAAFLAEPSPDTSRGHTLAAPGETPAPGLHTPPATPHAHPPSPSPQAGTAAPVVVASPTGLAPARQGPSWSLIFGLFGGGLAIAIGLVIAVMIMQPDPKSEPAKASPVEETEDEDEATPPTPSLPFDIDELIDPQPKGPSLLWNPQTFQEELEASMGDQPLITITVFPKYALIGVRNPAGEKKQAAKRKMHQFRFQGGAIGTTPKPWPFLRSRSQADYVFAAKDVDARRLPKMLAHVKTMSDKPVTHATFMRQLPHSRDLVWRLHTSLAYFEFGGDGEFRKRSR